MCSRFGGDFLAPQLPAVVPSEREQPVGRQDDGMVCASRRCNGEVVLSRNKTAGAISAKGVSTRGFGEAPGEPVQPKSTSRFPDALRQNGVRI